MAIVINGSGTVTGISVGGLPDGVVDSGTLATDSVIAAKLEASAIAVGDLPAGTILQVKEAFITGQVSYTGTVIYSGLQVAITPTSTSSKLWYQVNAGLSTSGEGRNEIYVKYGTTGGDNSGTKAGGQSQTAQPSAADTANLGHASISGILSPASTTQQYVKLILHKHDSGTGYLNYYSQTNSTQLTVMEIAGRLQQ